MPGFRGFAGKEIKHNETSIRSRLDSMAGMTHYGAPERVGMYIGKKTAVRLDDLSEQYRPEEHGESRSGNWISFLHGEIWDDETSRRKAHEKTPFNPGNDALYLLEKYLKGGPRALSEVSGSFQAVFLDTETETVILVTDYYGTRNFFYTEDSSGTIFASGMMPILSIKPELKENIDWIAVGEFLSMDYSLGTRTFLKDIGLVPPAHIAVIRDGRMELVRYWEMTYTPESAPFDYREQKERLKAILSETFPRIAGHNLGDSVLGSFLSGGFDSRTAVGLCAEHYPMQTHTFAEKNCIEVHYAAAVSRAAGAEHHVYELTPPDVSSAWPLGVRITDGMMSCRHYHGLSHYQRIAERTPVILDGFLGDLVMGCLIQDYAPMLESPRPFEESLFSYTAVAGNDFRSLLADGPGRPGTETGDAVFEDFRKILGTIQADTPFKRAEIFNFTNRQVKLIAQHCVKMPQAFMRVKNPFASRELRDFFLSVPAEARAGKKMYIESIIELLPRLVTIPANSAGESMLPLSPLNRIARFGYGLKRRIHKKIRSLAPSIISPFPWSYPAYGWWIRTDLRDLYHGMLLSRDSRCLSYFDRTALRNIMDSQAAGKINHELILSSLMSFELWHRMYLDGAGPDELSETIRGYMKTGGRGQTERRPSMVEKSIV